MHVHAVLGRAALAVKCTVPFVNCMYVVTTLLCGCGKVVVIIWGVRKPRCLKLNDSGAFSVRRPFFVLLDSYSYSYSYIYLVITLVYTLQ